MDSIRGFRLGDRIRFTAELERDDTGKRREWYPVTSEGSGIVVGHRVVRDGVVEYHSDWNEFTGETYRWAEFRQTGATPCLLVATDMRRAHIRVPFHAIVPDEGGRES